MHAGLDDEAAGHDQCEADPGGRWNSFTKNNDSTKDTDGSEDSDVNTKKLGEIPPDHVDHEAVAAERQKTQKNQKIPLGSQPLADEGIATDFQDRRRRKHKPSV